VAPGVGGERADLGNIAEQRALEKIGFAREGVMRGIGWRDGAWRDGVTYSLLRTDRPARVSMITED
jgi:RimJ/RimL family protein N-acetyltransferase